MLSLNNAKVCWSILDQLHQREKIRFVINKAEKGLVRVEDFEEMFHAKMFAVVPADYAAAVASINKGQAVTVAQPKSVISKKISEMAEKIIEIHTGVARIDEKKENKKTLFKFNKH